MAKRKRTTKLVERDPNYVPRSKEARTRGTDKEIAASGYRNRPSIETPGFVTPRARRWREVKKSPEERAELHALAYSMALAGCTLFQIAEAFKITVMTLWRWRAEDRKLDELLSIGMDVANRNVEASLYHKAMGYTYHSEEIKVINDEVVRVPTVVHLPPDNSSMFFWLKNRAGWRDVQQIEDVTPPSEAVDMRKAALAVIQLLKGAAGVLPAPDLTPTVSIDHDEDD